jgi:hypothetical protein
MIIEKLKNSNRLTRQEIEEANYQVAHLLQLNELERRKIEGKLDKNWKCKCWFCLKYPEMVEENLAVNRENYKKWKQDQEEHQCYFCKKG